jgi:hypothetical protein
LSSWSFQSVNKEGALASLLTDWQKEESTSSDAEFEFLEPVYSLRMAALKLLASANNCADATGALQQVLLHTAKTARLAGYYQVCRHLLVFSFWLMCKIVLGTKRQNVNCREI